ncbi:MAG: HD family phosphohydrolase [Thermodesulfovibrionales bacterium]
MPTKNTKNGISSKDEQPRFRDTLRKDAPYFVLFSLLSSVALLREFSLDRFIGGVFISAAIFAVFYKDIIRYRPAYVRQRSMILLLGVVVLGTLFLGRLAYFIALNFSEGIKFIEGDASRFVIPISAGAMLVTLLFDFHTALLFSFATSIMTGIWLGDAILSFYVITANLIASFSVLRCKKRTDILKGGILVSVVSMLSVLVLLLFSGNLFASLTPSALLFAALNGIAVAATVSICLPLLEHMFHRTTDISLLELLDLNQPLMKSLMINAPGTYHHSVIVGNLVEAAAQAVGVNPLLARVTAYYHDIGKMKMPEYFVENQAGSVSRHDKLSPHMSSMILISHVKEGVELARQYKLPQTVTDIIEQHHGTNLISYFYQKAKNATGGSPPEEDYRYPGPKPQSRVAALVMLADAVEASSRVLREPTPSRLEALTDKIVNHVFLDGQLDECELTLKDLSAIKRDFTYILTGIFHKRIDYPSFDFNVRTAEPHAQGDGDDSLDKKRPEAGSYRRGEIAEGRKLPS